MAAQYRKLQSPIPDTFDSLVTKVCTTSMLPIIRDDAINSVTGLMQGLLSYANYTQHTSSLPLTPTVADTMKPHGISPISEL
jgi:hypothetical protein